MKHHESHCQISDYIKILRDYIIAKTIMKYPNSLANNAKTNRQVVARNISSRKKIFTLPHLVVR